MAFQKATKKQAKGRMAIDGPSGSGKTYTALAVAGSLAPTGKIAVIDTERGSASKYADLFDFDVCELDTFEPAGFIKAIREAEEAGYECLVIDSLSHAWSGTGGILEQNDKVAAKNRGNSFAAWRETTPMHNTLVDAILGSSCHVITTMRTKTEWVMEEDDRGKKVPRKVGMAPVQRAGIEYEFDVVVDMDPEHRAVVSKSRCHALADEVIKNPGPEDLGKTFADWLTDGVEQTLSKSDLNRLQRAIIARIGETGCGLEVRDVGPEIVQAMGYAQAKEIPANRLGEALDLVSAWEPEVNQEPDDVDEKFGLDGDEAAA